MTTRSHRFRRRARRAHRAQPFAPLCAITLVGALVACGGESSPERPTDSVPPATVEPSAAGTPAAGPAATPGPIAAAGDECPMYGAWQPCSVVERLERAGFGLTPLPGSVRQPGIGTAGAAYRLGAAELQLFLFADSADARRAAASLDADDAEPAATRGIRRAPAVIRSANLVALLFNNNDRQLERVQLALTAGLPARGPDAP